MRPFGGSKPHFSRYSAMAFSSSGGASVPDTRDDVFGFVSIFLLCGLHVLTGTRRPRPARTKWMCKSAPASPNSLCRHASDTVLAFRGRYPCGGAEFISYPTNHPNGSHSLCPFLTTTSGPGPSSDSSGPKRCKRADTGPPSFVLVNREAFDTNLRRIGAYAGHLCQHAVSRHFVANHSA